MLFEMSRDNFEVLNSLAHKLRSIEISASIYL